MTRSKTYRKPFFEASATTSTILPLCFTVASWGAALGCSPKHRGEPSGSAKGTFRFRIQCKQAISEKAITRAVAAIRVRT